jgi:hypothetical protein
MEESKDNDDYFTEEEMDNLYDEYTYFQDYAKMMGKTIPNFENLKEEKDWNPIYKELARLFHPDRYRSPEDKVLFTDIFKYLNNLNKKMLYYLNVMQGGKRRRTRARRTKQRKTRKTRRTRRHAKKTRRYY